MMGHVAPKPERAASKGCGCVTLLVLGIVGVFFVVGVSSLMDERVPREQRTRQVPAPSPREPSASAPAEVVFDVPSLFGKSIDDIRRVLGNPVDEQAEPTELQLGLGEWENIFVRKKGQQESFLVITFDPQNRQVKDFFFAGDDTTVSMQRANVSEGNPAYRIEPVKKARDPSKITGIIITPTQYGLREARDAQMKDDAQRLEQQDERAATPRKQSAESEPKETVEPALRTWTDATGEYSVEAKFAGMAFGTVKLRRSDGVVIELAMDRLSEECQQWIRERGR